MEPVRPRVPVVEEMIYGAQIGLEYVCERTEATAAEVLSAYVTMAARAVQGAVENSEPEHRAANVDYIRQALFSIIMKLPDSPGETKQ